MGIHDELVLLCHDGSGHSAEAISRSSSLLGARPAIVLHVGGTASSDPVGEEGRRLAANAGFHPVSVAERAGRPVADAILAEAESRRVAVIVVGSRGLSGVRSRILGSVSSRLAHHARRPLLVVRPGSADAAQAPAFVCFDESDSARHAVATAGTLLAGREAIVANFQPAVDDAVVLQSTLPWPVGPTGESQLAAVDRDEALRPGGVAAYGAWLAERAGFAARSLSLANEGIAWSRLSEAADAEAASCIVVGHRRDADAGSQLGSTAYGVVQHANRPVLVVPAPDR
jgi:nucleotide-binding universal stress UspA family protein